MKKIAILGTGVVGQTIASRMIALGHEVRMGSRTAGNEKAEAWVKSAGTKASQGTFAEAAAFGEIIFLCTKGEATLNVLRMAGKEAFDGKTVIDISNPLDFSNGMPPSLFVCNTDSLGEQVQKELPGAGVVKTLNIVNCKVMVEASLCGGEATMFLCGNEEGPKTEVKGLLAQFGWKDVIDLGDISAARAMEMMLPVWLRTWMATGDGQIAFRIVRKGA